jgi:hypothetical protein
MSNTLAALVAASQKAKAAAPAKTATAYKQPTVNPDPAEAPVQVAPPAPDQIAEDIAAMGVTPPAASNPPIALSEYVDEARKALHARGIEATPDRILAFLLGKCG